MPPLNDQDRIFLRRALDLARQAFAAGNGPFGAVLTRDGRPVAEAGNTVGQGPDITAHAEINALRKACAATGQLHLTGATLYSSTEPCPMCFAAIHWAGIRRLVFSARIEDAASAGFRELPLSNRFLADAAGLRDLEIHENILRDEGQAVFDEYRHSAKRLTY